MTVVTLNMWTSIAPGPMNEFQPTLRSYFHSRVTNRLSFEGHMFRIVKVADKISTSAFSTDLVVVVCSANFGKMRSLVEGKSHTQWPRTLLWAAFFRLSVFRQAAEIRCNAVVTCEIKLFQHYFSLGWYPSEIILFQRVETCLELFQNYFRELLQLMNIFKHVQCRWNYYEIIFQNSFSGWNNFSSIADVVTCEIEHWDNFKIISNNHISHLTTV